MNDYRMTRREFLKRAALAGIAFSVPPALGRLAAAEETATAINDFMINRLSKAGAPDPLQFIFCADIHIPFDDRGVFSTVVKKANEMNVDFVLFGGDCVQVGNPTNFSIFIKRIKKFKMPVICAMGNHDTAFDDYAEQEEWKKRFGAPHFRFDAGGIRVIALNNADFALPEADFAFLDESLKTDLRKFIVMHRPPDYLNSLYTTPMQDDAGRFRKLVEGGGVTAVLTGHEHHYSHYLIGGVHYIVSGGAGGMLNTNTENNYHHFIHITAGKNVFDYDTTLI